MQPFQPGKHQPIQEKRKPAGFGLRFLLAAFCLLGLAMAGFGIYFIALGNAARSWPRVEGRVISTRIRIDYPTAGTQGTRSQRQRLRQFYPSITYSWTVEGQSYTGSRYQLGTTHEKYDERQEAVKAAARFPAGAPIPVYYEPGNPSQAVLDPRTSAGVYVPLPLGLLILGLGWLGLRHRGALERAIEKGE